MEACRKAVIARITAGRACNCLFDSEVDEFILGRATGACATPCHGCADGMCGGRASCILFKLSYDDSEGKHSPPRTSLHGAAQHVTSSDTEGDSGKPESVGHMGDIAGGRATKTPAPDTGTGATDIDGVAPPADSPAEVISTVIRSTEGRLSDGDYAGPRPSPPRPETVGVVDGTVIFQVRISGTPCG